MKKKLIILLLLVFSNINFAQVELQIVDLKVNNQPTTNINLNSQSLVNLKFTVNLKTFDGDFNNVQGNLLVNTKNSGNSTSIVRDVKPITFTVTYPPFVTQTTYNGVTYIDLNLSASEFYQNGGVLYVEYKNNNAQSFYSSNINITGGNIPDNVDLPPGRNTICCDQVVYYGDIPQGIVGSNIDSNRVLTWLQYDANSNYVGPVGSNAISNGRNLLKPDYLFETVEYKRFINPSQTQNGGWSNKVRIEVIQNPITSNYIFLNETKVSDDVYEINEGELIEAIGTTSYFNQNVLDNPSHVPSRTDETIRVTEYQWQYSTGKFPKPNEWNDIEGESLSTLYNYLPHGYPSNSKIVNLRRIAKYQNISRVSNIIQIKLLNNSITNSICCDQELRLLTDGVTPPQTITGSDVLFNFDDVGHYNNNFNSINYQVVSYNVIYNWQEQLRNEYFTDVNNTSRDYLPTSTPTSIGSYNEYRRVATINYTVAKVSNPNYLVSGSYNLYSNPVKIYLKGRTRSRMSNNDMENIKLNDKEILIYPNPAQKDFNILINNNNILKVLIYNNLGVVVKQIDIKEQKNRNLTIDVSDLSSGIYILNIETESKSYIEKIIID